MDSLYILTSSLFFLWIIRNIFYWVWVWQNNDYDIFSFISNFKNEIVKRNIYGHLLLIYKLILIALFFYIVRADDLLLYYQQSISIVYFIEFYIVLKEIYQNEIKKPSIIFRSAVIIIFSILNTLLIFSVPLVDKFLWLLVVDIALVPFIGFFVFLISFPIEIYVDIQTEKALNKIKNHKNLLTIVVLGNLGVRETKKSLVHILNKEYKILKIKESESTVLGITKVIRSKLTKDINLIITGMKANNQDEIRLINELLSPKIIIITGIINDKLYANHLITLLPKNSITLFNGRDKNAYWLYQTTRKNKAIYNYLTIPADITINRGNNHSIIAYNINQKADKIAFDVIMDNKSIHLVVNESKQHKIEYILPAIYAANYLGLKNSTIKTRLLG